MTADWRAYAVCGRLTQPDIMFPDPSDWIGVEEARQVCAACPVKRECLEEALADEGGKTKDSLFGVRGGKTPMQRFGIYKHSHPSAQNGPKPRGTGRSLSPCGTAASYDRHCRLGEPIDDACRDAHNDKNRAQKARQRAVRAEAVT